MSCLLDTKSAKISANTQNSSAVNSDITTLCLQENGPDGSNRARNNLQRATASTLHALTSSHCLPALLWHQSNSIQWQISIEHAD